MKNILEKSLDNRIEILKEQFPECFYRDGNLNIQKLQEILEPSNKVFKDSYSLNWLGKTYARKLAQLPISTVLSEDKEHNEKEENKKSENVYIKGDNLEALRHLISAYSEKIKMIYIDPPYNTKNGEFVYNDNRSFTEKELEKLMAENIIVEDEKERILYWIDNKSSSHSAWLTFMFPRIYLARKLLREDGVIFISIDDNEASQLKLLCDEVFGEENFIAEIIIVVNPGGRDYNQIAVTHEYLFCYGKSGNSELLEVEKNIKFDMVDVRGGYEIRELRNRNPKFTADNRPNLFYPFYVNAEVVDRYGYNQVSLLKNEKFNVEVYPYNSAGKKSVWRWGVPKAGSNIDLTNIENSEIVAKIKKNGEYNIYEKCRKATTKVKSIWSETEMRTEDGTRLVRELFVSTPFDHPKPLIFLKKILQIGTSKNDIILDFFSGSATTAHAVMQLNAEDGGNRKYIMVQLEEEIEEGKEAYKFCKENNLPTNITSIGIERIKRASKKIKEETKAEIDYGFKIYSVKDLPNTMIESIEKFDPNTIKLFETKLLTEEEKNAILTTYKVFDGNMLNENIESINLGDSLGYKVGNILYLIDEIKSSSVIKNIIEKLDLDRDFSISKIVIYGYSQIEGKYRTELCENIKTYANKKSAKIDVEVRY